MALRTRWLIGVSVVVGLLFGPGTVDLVWLTVQQRRLDRQLAQLQATQKQLIAEEARLRSDPAYVEGLIRTTFKYAEPDELVIPLDAGAAKGKTR